MQSNSNSSAQSVPLSPEKLASVCLVGIAVGAALVVTNKDIVHIGKNFSIDSLTVSSILLKVIPIPEAFKYAATVGAAVTGLSIYILKELDR